MVYCFFLIIECNELEGVYNMKKIIPFQKEIIFKTNLAEITSISLEHSLHKEEEHLITGSFLLNGEYKITDTSTNTDVFSFDLPFDIHMDDHYILDRCSIEIDDFYYEIVNENVLAVNIDVCVDQLEEKPLIEKEELERVVVPKEDHLVKEEFQTELEEEPIQVEKIEVVEPEPLEREEYKTVKEDRVEPVKQEEKVEFQENTLFASMDDSNETYMTYHVYIVREGDSIETVLTKYGVTKEELMSYNDLSEIKLGDKLIIPAIYNETSE